MDTRVISTLWLLWNNAAMTMGVQVSARDPAFNYLGYIPRSRIAGSHGNLMFNFFEELPHHFPQ